MTRKKCASWRNLGYHFRRRLESRLWSGEHCDGPHNSIEKRSSCAPCRLWHRASPSTRVLALGYSLHLQEHAPEVQYLLSDMFQSLDEDFFRQARALIRQQTPKLKKRKPGLHQKRAIKNAVTQFLTNNEGRRKPIHPCGDHLQLSVTTP